MLYVVKSTGKATESNINFKGEISTHYIGKDGYVHDKPEQCEPWKRKRYAEKYINEAIEWDEHIDETCGGHYWDHFYEIVEV